MIPALIVPFRMIRTKYFVLVTLPVFASFNAMVLVKSNRWDLLRFWLRTKVRVLRFDLLHLLRSGLFPCACSSGLCVLLATCGRWLGCIRLSCRRISRCFRGLSRAFGIFPLLLSLLVLTRFQSIRRLIARPSLSVFSSIRLVRPSASRLTRRITFCIRRLVAGVRLLALFCARSSRSFTLVCRATRIRRSVFLRCFGLSRWSLLSLGRVRAGLCFSGARFFRCALAL